MAIPPSADVVTSPPATVLVVDDDEDISLLLSSLFRRVGLRSVVAHDGAHALVAARVERPALVVLDLGLPDIDGLDLMPEIRELTAARILVLTARTQDDEQLAAAQADDHVTKPFANDELLARCLALLGRQAGSAADNRHDRGHG